MVKSKSSKRISKNNKTKRVLKNNIMKKTMHKHTKATGGSRGTQKTKKKKKVLPPLLKDDFMDEMYENMWTFINPDSIMSVLRQSGCNLKFKYKADVDDDDWSDDDYTNSIVFKGNPDEGHYVYIDAKGEVYGTYECDILTSIEDDGICHGFALSAALNDCGWNIGNIILNPKPNEKKTNYNTIMNGYKTLIEQGWWDNALEETFYGDVHWLPKKKRVGAIRTKESLKAFELLNNLNL